MLTGLGIGVGAGVSPGPLMVLVITATLRGGWRHGAASAAAPLASDIPIVLISLLTLGQLPLTWLSWLGVVGGLVVVLVGLQTVRDGRTAELPKPGEEAPGVGKPLGQAVLVNLLSPHPWLTWLTVIGPLALRQGNSSVLAAVLLGLGFYVGLIGSKVVLAVLVGRGSRSLTDTGYRRILKIAGVALALFGVAMAAEFGTQAL